MVTAYNAFSLSSLRKMLTSIMYKYMPPMDGDVAGIDIIIDTPQFFLTLFKL